MTAGQIYVAHDKTGKVVYVGKAKAGQSLRSIEARHIRRKTALGKAIRAGKIKRVSRRTSGSKPRKSKRRTTHRCTYNRKTKTV